MKYIKLAKESVGRWISWNESLLRLEIAHPPFWCLYWRICGHRPEICERWQKVVIAANSNPRVRENPVSAIAWGRLHYSNGNCKSGRDAEAIRQLTRRYERFAFAFGKNSHGKTVEKHIMCTRLLKNCSENEKKKVFEIEPQAGRVLGQWRWSSTHSFLLH
jgi:hypothetical protein